MLPLTASIGTAFLSGAGNGLSVHRGGVGVPLRNSNRPVAPNSWQTVGHQKSSRANRAPWYFGGPGWLSSVCWAHHRPLHPFLEDQVGLLLRDLKRQHGPRQDPLLLVGILNNQRTVAVHTVQRLVFLNVLIGPTALALQHGNGLTVRLGPQGFEVGLQFQFLKLTFRKGMFWV